MGRCRGMAGALACAALLVGTQGLAHQMACEKTVNGSDLALIDSFPATLHYELTVMNTHPFDSSTALSVEDSLLSPLGWSFTPAPPFTLGVGGSVTDSYDLVISNEQECARLAAADQTRDLSIDNTLTVTWDLGSATCSARVMCPQPPPPPGECTAPTRTIGYWKTHLEALEACVAMGPIDLGIVTVTTIQDFEGILWGNPARFGNGGKRNSLDQIRFIAARQLLGAECNVRVLGAAPPTAGFPGDAVQIIQGTDCPAIGNLAGELDQFNQSCDSVEIPGGGFGNADPQASHDLAADPTSASGEVCGGPIHRNM